MVDGIGRLSIGLYLEGVFFLELENIGNVVKRPGDLPIGHLLYRPVSLFLFQRFDQIIIVFLEFVQLICQVQSRQDRNFGN